MWGRCRTGLGRGRRGRLLVGCCRIREGGDSRERRKGRRYLEEREQREESCLVAREMNGEAPTWYRVGRRKMHLYTSRLQSGCRSVCSLSLLLSQLVYAPHLLPHRLTIRVLARVLAASISKARFPFRLFSRL